jgi:hypothetical protein
MRTESAVVTQAAALLKPQLYEIHQRLDVTTLAFVVMDANLKDVVGKIRNHSIIAFNLRLSENTRVQFKINLA